jgi:ribosomal protein S18 acetylase RimI-like enzyme
MAALALSLVTATTCWEEFARGTPGATLQRLPGAAVAVFPNDPERAVYNNAVLDPGRIDAVDSMEALYAEAAIDHFAAWVHETDVVLQHELERRGYSVHETTRAMRMSLDELRLPRPELDLSSVDWPGYARLLGLPEGLLSGVDREAVHLLVARLDGENVATALAYDHDGDCGIFNVWTLERARRRGLATALVLLHLHDAIRRGCRTASLQSTPMAESMYAAVGFRDLGLILEYVRSSRAVRSRA